MTAFQLALCVWLFGGAGPDASTPEASSETAEVVANLELFENLELFRQMELIETLSGVEPLTATDAGTPPPASR